MTTLDTIRSTSHTRSTGRSRIQGDELMVALRASVLPWGLANAVLLMGVVLVAALSAAIKHDELGAAGIGPSLLDAVSFSVFVTGLGMVFCAFVEGSGVSPRLTRRVLTAAWIGALGIYAWQLIGYLAA